jgi:hypothetical protein
VPTSNHRPARQRPESRPPAPLHRLADPHLTAEQITQAEDFEAESAFFNLGAEASESNGGKPVTMDDLRATLAARNRPPRPVTAPPSEYFRQRRLARRAAREAATS